MRTNIRFVAYLTLTCRTQLQIGIDGRLPHRLRNWPYRRGRRPRGRRGWFRWLCHCPVEHRLLMTRRAFDFRAQPIGGEFQILPALEAGTRKEFLWLIHSSVKSTLKVSRHCHL